MRRRLIGLVAVPLLAGLAGCAPQNSADNGSSASRGASPGSCAVGSLPVKQPGQLTVGTDSPAYPPWFVNNDPTNGKGYESAVAYAVAKELGFSRDQVKWVKVRFNNSYKPGPKNYDFDINQISITAAREKAVDFSEGYYYAGQAVIALASSPIAQATSISDLARYQLGAQTGTTSLTAIREVIKPDRQPLVFQDTNAAKQALLNGQIDGFLADVPTAFYITDVEIPQGKIIGQFQPQTGEQERFGMLFEQGSGLVPCVNRALRRLKSDGTLAKFDKRWLSDVVDVPVLK